MLADLETVNSIGGNTHTASSASREYTKHGEQVRHLFAPGLSLTIISVYSFGFAAVPPTLLASYFIVMAKEYLLKGHFILVLCTS